MVKANSHTQSCVPTMPRLCHGMLIHTNWTVALPCFDIAMSFVKVIVVARKIWTADLLHIVFMFLSFTSKPWTSKLYKMFPPTKCFHLWWIFNRLWWRWAKKCMQDFMWSCLQYQISWQSKRCLCIFSLCKCLILITITPSLSWKWFWRNCICYSTYHLAA